MKNAPFFSLNLRDLVKGFVVSVLTVVVAGLSETLSTGVIPTLERVQSLGVLGLAAGGAYILKNLFTNSKDQLLTKEPKNENPKL